MVRLNTHHWYKSHTQITKKIPWSGSVQCAKYISKLTRQHNEQSMNLAIDYEKKAQW